MINIHRKKNVQVRKLYEKHFGEIPVDSNGVTYHIHHIDGNHTNNDPSNLQAVTVHEHYNIHLEAGDYELCLLLAQYIDMTYEQRSELARRAANSKVSENRHIFQNAEWKSQNEMEKIAKGTHNSQNKVTCPHCGITGPKSNLIQYHFANCKHRCEPISTEKQEQEDEVLHSYFVCPYCEKKSKRRTEILKHIVPCKGRNSPNSRNIKEIPVRIIRD